MADKQDKTAQEARADQAQDKARIDQANQAEAAEKRLDHTVPGGRYIVDGRLVNANGEEIKVVESGK